MPPPAGENDASGGDLVVDAERRHEPREILLEKMPVLEVAQQPEVHEYADDKEEASLAAPSRHHAPGGKPVSQS